MIINHPLLGPRDSQEFVYLGDANLIGRPDWQASDAQQKAAFISATYLNSQAVSADFHQPKPADLAALRGFRTGETLGSIWRAALRIAVRGFYDCSANRMRLAKDSFVQTAPWRYWSTTSLTLKASRRYLTRHWDMRTWWSSTALPSALA